GEGPPPRTGRSWFSDFLPLEDALPWALLRRCPTECLSSRPPGSRRLTVPALRQSGTARGGALQTCRSYEPDLCPPVRHRFEPRRHTYCRPLPACDWLGTVLP